jgi:hypothetical protein
MSVLNKHFFLPVKDNLEQICGWLVAGISMNVRYYQGWEPSQKKKAPPSFARLEELEGRLDIDILNFLHWKAGAYGIESSIR